MNHKRFGFYAFKDIGVRAQRPLTKSVLSTVLDKLSLQKAGRGFLTSQSLGQADL